MNINELINKLQVPTTTWEIPVLVDGKEIESVQLLGSNNEGEWHIEIKSKVL